MKNPILFATSNNGKLNDARHFFRGVDTEILSTKDLIRDRNLSEPPDVEETGSTYRDNASLKVKGYFEWGGIPTIADDSGLEVEALNGEPGVYSARFAGPGCTYLDNINKMLTVMKGESNRRAKFIAVIAYTVNGIDLHFEEGVIEGEITLEPRGEGGFGYDPIFEVQGLGKTLAELKSESSERIDTHRTRALAKFVDYIQESL